MSGHLRKEILRKQTSICPYDETVGLLKGGLQRTPKWFNSVKKYPPEQMWLRAGRMPRPAEFYRDRNRRIMNLNAARPDWVPSLQFDNVGMQTADAFSKGVQGFDPDVEFAACQSHFMKKKGMDEEEAYEQARFKMRDLTRQKQRVWEVYHRFKYGVKLDENKRHADIWIDQLENEHSTDAKDNDRNLSPRAFENIRHDGLRKHEIRMKLATSMKARIKLTEELRERIIQKRKTAEETNAPNERTWKELTEVEQENYIRDRLVHDPEMRKEHAYIWERETEREIQLNRFIEMCDYIGRNKSTLGAGVKDPTEYIEGIEKQEQRELLMNEMARRMLPTNHDPEKKLLKHRRPEQLPEPLLVQKKESDGRDLAGRDTDFQATPTENELTLAEASGYQYELFQRDDGSWRRAVYGPDGNQVRRADGKPFLLIETSTALVDQNGTLCWCNTKGEVFDLSKNPRTDHHGQALQLEMHQEGDGSTIPLVGEQGKLVKIDHTSLNPWETYLDPDKPAPENDPTMDGELGVSKQRIDDWLADLSEPEEEMILSFDREQDLIEYLSEGQMAPDEADLWKGMYRRLHAKKFDDLEDPK